MDLERWFWREYSRGIEKGRQLAEKFRSTSPHPLYQGWNLVETQKYRCGQLGLLAGLAGAPLGPVAIPVNILFLFRRRLEMLIGLALLGGFEPESPLVQVKVWRILIGGEGGIPVGKGATEGFKRLSLRGGLHTLRKKGAGKVIAHLIGRVGGQKGGAKLVPVVGGVVSGGLDLYLCYQTGKEGIGTFLGCKILEGRGFHKYLPFFGGVPDWRGGEEEILCWKEF